MYSMFGTNDQLIMKLSYKPSVGHVIGNDKTGKFYEIIEVNQKERICRAYLTTDPRFYSLENNDL